MAICRRCGKEEDLLCEECLVELEAERFMEKHFDESEED
jgi:hypothetical protein